jgi:hypothetical protein
VPVRRLIRSPGCLAIGFFLLNLPRTFGADLRPETRQGFERYVHAAEARMEQDRRRPEAFLYIDSLPSSVRQAVLANVQEGGIYVVRLDARDDKGKPIRTPDGWVHHWLAAMRVPGATLAQVVAVDQDYDNYQNFYRPEIVRSRLLEHQDDTFKVFARVQKKTPWLTVTLDTYSDVRYVFLDAGHMYTESRSFRIQQVDNAGTPSEHIYAPGQGSGFLWALDTYWRYEATIGGILVESETVALTRTVPFGLGWIVKPFVHRATVETAKEAMIRSREVIQQERQPHPQTPRRN